MHSSGLACSLLLLMTAAVSSGRNAREYFQQAGFQHSPSRPEDALVFFTVTAPPLICELEMEGDWIGGDRLNADLLLTVPGAVSYYTCSFEGNATTRSNLKLIEKSLPGVFIPRGEQTVEFSYSYIYCTSDSRLPDEYFQLKIQRPNEDRLVKCRNERLDRRVYLRFPGYPTIICPFSGQSSHYAFTLVGIVNDELDCTFQVYSDLRTWEKHTEKKLYQSLVSGLPTRLDGRLTDVVCSHHASPYSSVHFHVRLPGGSIYDCSFSKT